MKCDSLQTRTKHRQFIALNNVMDAKPAGYRANVTTWVIANKTASIAISWTNSAIPQNYREIRMIEVH